MATRERLIEGTWLCSSCGKTEIPARVKNCPACNNPREGGHESVFSFGDVTETGASELETVTDPKALELAAAGADWLCTFCGTANRGDKTVCRHCGAPRAGGEPLAVQDEHAPAPAPLAPQRRAQVRAPRSKHAPARPRGRKRWILAAVAASVLGLVFWATRTHEAHGVVVSKQWTRTVHREEFSPTTKEGWLEELRPARPVMPVNGRGESPGVEDIRGCARQMRGTRKVPDGTQRVCHTKSRQRQCGTEQKCTVTHLKNGFAKETCRDVPKYCSESYEDCQQETRYRDEPVYGQRCSYTTWEWREDGARTLSGGDTQPQWPDVNPGPLGRLRREESYSVSITYRDGDSAKTHEVHPTSEQAFAQWKPGQQVELTITNVGNVSGVRRR